MLESQLLTMTDRMIYSAGTQIVSLQPVLGSRGRTAHPAGAVAVILKSPTSHDIPYRVRFHDGLEADLYHHAIQRLAEFQQGPLLDGLLEPNSGSSPSFESLVDRIIFRVVVGSRAFGLAGENSDFDRRGIYLPSARMHWSLAGVPEQLENDATQEAYWEIEKFLVLALKSNPNVLETLYSPEVEFATPLALELIAMREVFLSKLIYQTYNGYVMSQFKKIQSDLRNQGTIKWKHVMHLIRLQYSGIHALRERAIQVHVGEHRALLLAIKSGELPWEEVNQLRLSLNREFDHAFTTTTLPTHPNYDQANQFLIRARHLALESTLP